MNMNHEIKPSTAVYINNWLREIRAIASQLNHIDISITIKLDKGAKDESTRPSSK